MISEKAGARGANIVCADINEAGLKDTIGNVTAAGGKAVPALTDVTKLDQVKSAVAAAVENFGSLDVMVNCAGTMPLAFFSDHETAMGAWERCIDINFKGTLNGMVAAHDQMIKQGRGHVINFSSIYGNHPVVGSAVYGATKAAVNYMSESFRAEHLGKIKLTIVKPTGVPGTSLGAGVINPEAVVGILGQNAAIANEIFQAAGEGKLEPEKLDADNPEYALLEPQYIADQVIFAIDQPWGVSIGDITVRATGDQFIL